GLLAHPHGSLAHPRGSLAHPRGSNDGPLGARIAWCSPRELTQRLVHPSEQRARVLLVEEVEELGPLDVDVGVEGAVRLQEEGAGHVAAIPPEAVGEIRLL